MRTRTRGVITSTPLNTFTETTTCEGTVTKLDSYPTSIRNGDQTVTTDVVNPGFHRLRAKGHTFCNGYSSLRTVESTIAVGEDVQTYLPTCSGGTTKKVRYGPFANNANGLNADPNGNHSSNIESAITLASTSALANIEAPDVQGLVEMAEFGKTLKLVPGLVRNSVDSLTKLSKTKRFIRSGKTLLDYCSSTYLAARYGITPVVYTLEGLGKAMNRAVSEPVRKTARGSAVVPSLITEGADELPGTIKIQRTFYTSITTQIRAGVLYEQSLDFDAYGVRVQELPSALWELTTLSFAADWFVNIGDYLRAVVPKVGVKQLQSWYTMEQVVTKRATYRTVPNNTDPNWILVCNRSGSSNVNTIARSRVCGISAGLATKFHEITFEKRKDFLHAADTLALFSQFLLGYGKPVSYKFKSRLN